MMNIINRVTKMLEELGVGFNQLGFLNDWITHLSPAGKALYALLDQHAFIPREYGYLRREMEWMCHKIKIYSM